MYSIMAKPTLMTNNAMPYVWRGWKTIVHYELLPPGQTISSDIY